MAITLLTPVQAAQFTITDHPGGWAIVIVECEECLECVTWAKKCKALMRGRCKRLPRYHVHHVCLTCGHVWLTEGWKL